MIELLKRISDGGIVLDLNEGELQLFASDTNIDSGLLSEIKANKEKLVSYLTKQQNWASRKKTYQPHVNKWRNRVDLVAIIC